MPNPLKNWKLGRKPAEKLPDDQNIIPLMQEPHKEDNGKWGGIVATTIPDRRSKPPDLRGKMVIWEGDVYLVEDQAVITDTHLIRDLNHLNRHKTGLRIYLSLTMKKADRMLALRAAMRGRRKR